MIITIISLLIYLILGFILPLLIVIKWKAHPIFALIFAILLAFLGWVAPGIIRMFLAMMIYGTANPQLMAGSISYALSRAFLALPIVLPILIFAQWLSRRRTKVSEKAKIVKTAFE